MNMRLKYNAAIETISPTLKALLTLAYENSAEACDPISISVDARGVIMDCSNTSEQFFGYRRRDLVSHHISKLFSELVEIELIQNNEFNQSLVYLCRCGKLLQAKNRLGDTLFCYLNFVHLDNNGKNTFRLIASPADNARSQFPYSFEY
jgi:PAS domain S-box-containing protein